MGRSVKRDFRRCKAAYFGAGLTIAAILLGLPMIEAYYKMVTCSDCRLNFAILGSGLKAQGRTSARLPAAFTSSSDGTRLQSWRLLIMPWAEGVKTFYDKFDLEQPWNAEANSSVTDDRGNNVNEWHVPLYGCPSDTSPTAGRPITTKVMVIGDNSVSPGRIGRSLSDLPRGAANTILIVEAVDSGINWREPRDFMYERMSFRINDLRADAIASRHAGGAFVTMADGSAKFLSSDVNPQLVKGMLGK